MTGLVVSNDGRRAAAAVQTVPFKEAEIFKFQEAVGLVDLSYKDLYLLLDRVFAGLDTLQPQTLDALFLVQGLYSTVLQGIGVDFANIATISKLQGLTSDEKKLMEFITLHAELSLGGDTFLPEIRGKLDELNNYNQRLTEHANDLRLKGFQKHPGDLQKIKRYIASGKRLTPEQAKLLCATYSCIIAEPEAIFKFFPMDEGLIDILVFDEASQVSIAHSLSLILRAKQVLVFGDKYQYGAVSAVNVSRRYGGAYFKKIIDDYVREYNKTISEEYQKRLIEEETAEVADEDLFVADTLRADHLDADKEWIKTFSIRMSTLDFCQAIYNYHGSLTEHFRSFAEIIDYSNEFFYRKAQIPLVVNRLRTKPIDAVLRFIKVETQGHSGKNVNLDEIETIRQDIERLTADGYRGTIGIITSFREQRTRAEYYLRQKLSNFHRLKEENQLAIWFVGDVQGEERDVVYYSFVQDKKYGDAPLRSIYPTPGGTADTINSLKMQRLNVGFSRAKDTMVFVHSMDLDDYTDSRLGDALKYYRTLLEETRPKDHFIADETIFESPKEKELYILITQSDFYRQHLESLKIIPQFDIGKYIQQEYQKFIPRYRVDFLLTIADGGKEKSLILEYDGLEYHTKDPAVVQSLEDFKEEYLDYDIARQLELESYGYHFLRINKFTLLPKAPGQTRLEVLNDLLERAFTA
jgi:very-short-patch-repair endonuclease